MYSADFDEFELIIFVTNDLKIDQFLKKYCYNCIKK